MVFWFSPTTTCNSYTFFSRTKTSLLLHSKSTCNHSLNHKLPYVFNTTFIIMQIWLPFMETLYQHMTFHEIKLKNNTCIHVKTHAWTFQFLSNFVTHIYEILIQGTRSKTHPRLLHKPPNVLYQLLSLFFFTFWCLLLFFLFPFLSLRFDSPFKERTPTAPFLISMFSLSHSYVIRLKTLMYFFLFVSKG